jgi:hypothetical protein
MSFKYEVEVDGKFSGNAVRFATEEEANAGGSELLSRWFVPTGYRVVSSDDPVNYEIKDGVIQSIG